MITLDELMIMIANEELELLILNTEIIEKKNFSNVFRDYGKYSVVTDWEFDEFNGVDCIVAYTM